MSRATARDRGAPDPERHGLSGSRTTARGAPLVFALALAARLAVVAWAATRIPPTADGKFYDTIARRIAQGLGYTWLWPDGAVTNAGHYPIGYPALTGAVYAVAGPHPAAMMVVNALLGALAAVAAYRLAERAGGRRAAAAAGALVALHPGLVAYTPALMTEGVTATLLICAAWAADSPALGGASSRRWPRLLVTGLILGAATLVRPQSLVLAPVLGWLAVREARAGEPLRRRAWRAVTAASITLVTALAVCAPWTARNCVQMKRCALVSYNGGWNLLIGADEASTGSWSEIKVPPECREVFDEAEKDFCFGGAARRYIAEHPGKWLALAPKKLAATFDYAGAGGWYLHEANSAAFSDTAKLRLGAVETLFERVMLILALAAAARRSFVRLRALWAHEREALARKGAGPALIVAGALLGTVAALQLHAWYGHILLIFLLLAGWAPQAAPSDEDGKARPMLPLAAAAVLLSLAVTHAVFFGAGRYSLVAFPFVTALAPLAFVPRREANGS